MDHAPFDDERAHYGLKTSLICVLRALPVHLFINLRIVSLIVVALLGLAGRAHAQCSSPANSVVAENCLPGNSPNEWDIQAGNADDMSIQGFSTDISVIPGNTIGFKINTNASAYAINVYRMGYYGGLGARKVATLSLRKSAADAACLQDTATKMTDCGNWSVSASWTVPSTAVSGIYFAHLVRTDTGGDSHIVFVVRNDASTSAILFKPPIQPGWLTTTTGTGVSMVPEPQTSICQTEPLE